MKDVEHLLEPKAYKVVNNESRDVLGVATTELLALADAVKRFGIEWVKDPDVVPLYNDAEVRQAVADLS